MLLLTHDAAYEMIRKFDGVKVAICLLLNLDPEMVTDNYIAMVVADLPRTGKAVKIEEGSCRRRSCTATFSFEIYVSLVPVVEG